MKLITFNLPCAHAEQLCSLAREHDRSVSAELRRAVRQYLQRATTEKES